MTEHEMRDRIERLQALDQARLGTIAVLEKTLADQMTAIGNAQHHQDGLIKELLAALQGIVERGTDSPQHQAAEAAIRRAREWIDTGR